MIKRSIKSRKKIAKKRKGDDKIFDNSYNKGEVEYEVFNEIEIEQSFISSRLDPYYNSHDYFRFELLYKKMDKIYKKTDWSKMYKGSKKIPKQELCQIYEYLRSRIEDTTYTHIEIFIAIADFLGVNYKNLHDSLPFTYREQLLAELDKTYDIVDKPKVKKLF